MTEVQDEEEEEEKEARIRLPGPRHARISSRSWRCVYASVVRA